MEETNKKIDYEWLTKPTGDPFADVGGYVIKYLMVNNPEKDILDLIKYLANIYVNKWEGKINPFFLNSAITQPAYKGDVKIKETIKYFTSLLDETSNCKMGFCRISGRKTKLFKAGRDNSLMSGSGTFVNFHSNFQLGLMLSKEIIIRMFFIPFGAIYVGGRIVIINSSNTEVTKFFIERNCKENIKAIASSSSTSVLKSEFGIPSNALFNFVDDISINKLKEIETEDNGNFDLAMYHFTNFGASPDIVIYKLPSTIFRFYSTCLNSNLKQDWQPFILAHYTNSKFKGAKFNVETLNYEILKKEESESVAYDDFKTWRNLILESLLIGKSILRMFVKWGTKHKFNFTIVELYQLNVQNMKQETLNKIKELAHFLTDTDSDTIKKSIKALDGYKSAYELRRFFLKNIVVKNYKDGAKEAIITMDELVSYLFPDDISWRDIRDILLFAIYQNLHAKNLVVDAELSNEEVIETEAAEN
ncbi:MAG: type I-B CRISPR-associated protein Cas8b1/Cst1 [Bacteroidales bacterium]|nr:type I-B CRISPR-associated protein Cas8b1/Cst1 [Bacteroidales bacterium]